MGTRHDDGTTSTSKSTSKRPGRSKRLFSGLLGAALLTALTMVVTAPTASAAVDEGIGHEIRPGQPYEGDPGNRDWVGSYVLGGKQVFCVQFAFKAPDTDEQYEPGDELLTKWGEKLEPEVASHISYLLLRYGDTQDADEAAALAHLLHSWTSGPRTPADLDPGNDFRNIGYDIALHRDRLPEGAQQAIDRLKADAQANHGPWTAAVTAPEQPQTIGTPADWSVRVNNAADKGMAEVPVTLRLTDATLENGEDTGTVNTDENGAVQAKITPTGPNPKVVATLDSPADVPRVQEPVQVGTQRIVSTGGEKEISAEATTPARTQPGTVAVSKVDAKTDDPLSGVALRITGQDKKTPAVGQDDKPLTGPDGKPVVLTSGKDGKATVTNLRTPQRICVVEVSAPKGYEDAFNPKQPPSACGDVTPGETLALKVANAPNKPTIPQVIPAGAEPGGTGGPDATALAGFGALGLAGAAAGLGGLLWRRRALAGRTGR